MISPPTGAARVVDIALRIVAGGLALVGGFLTGLLSMLLVPLRVADLPGLWPLLVRLGLASYDTGALRVPIALVVAVGGILLLCWFVRAGTGVRWGTLLPALGWFSIVLLVLGTTTEGDRLVMPNDWLAALTLFGGTIVLVVMMVIGLTTPGGSAGRSAAGR